MLERNLALNWKKVQESLKASPLLNSFSIDQFQCDFVQNISPPNQMACLTYGGQGRQVTNMLLIALHQPIPK